MLKKYARMSLDRRRGVWGVVFLLPWLTGLILFFLGPLIETILYSFSQVSVSLDGIERTWLGLDNFRHAFTVDPFFNEYLIRLAWPSLAIVAIVVIFSLLAAMLINGKYPGRGIVRAIFFIPIIMGANIATAVIVGDDLVTQATATETSFGGFGYASAFFITTLMATGLPAELTGFVVQAITGIFQVLAQAGVPILIFLAGLQSIPASLYEVADIEGCTMYESFWKVTLPMVSPMILLSTVYTVVDLFARHSIAGGGPFLQRIRQIGFVGHDYGLASAMVVIYILACMLVISLITYIMSKAVFYYD